MYTLEEARREFNHSVHYKRWEDFLQMLFEEGDISRQELEDWSAAVVA